MRTNRFIVYAAATALVSMGVALSGCSEPPARVEAPPPKVSVAHPQVRKLVDTDPYNGWLQAAEKVDIRSRVRGHLDKIHFTDGDLVKKGQLLFELDPRTFQAEVGRAADQVKIYEAQQVAAAKEEARFRELVTKGGASQSQVDQAEASTKSLDAEIAAAKEEVTRKELDLKYSRITSPIDGRIGRALFTVGNLINAGAGEDVLTTIVSVDPINIYFSIDERSLQRYRARYADEKKSDTVREQKIPFTFKQETDTDYVHSGVIDFADNRVDSSTGTIEVRGVVKNDKMIFVPGSRVSVRVPVSEEREVIIVPDTAVLTDQSRKYLLVVDDKKVVQRRDVELGRLLDDQMRIVLHGGGRKSVSAEDWIVTQGLQMARINYPVEPIVPAAAPATQAAPSTQTAGATR